MQPLWTAVQKVLTRLNVEIRDIAIPLLDTHSPKLKAESPTNICMLIGTEVLFTVAKKWEWPSVHQQVYGGTKWSIHAMDTTQP